MAQQTNPQTITAPSLETSKAPPSLANPADDSALTTDTATTYTSLPLTHSKSTRVLRILPSKSDQTDTIHIELQTISLDDDPPPQFCALSYVWGSPSWTRRIMVNNEPFLVRKNLWNFLDLMRRREFSDLLWIDAICINQDCIPERNHQVSVMGDIYRGATRVIAWLGPESELICLVKNTPEQAEMEISTTKKSSQAPILDSIRLIVDDLSMVPRDDQHEAEVTELTTLVLTEMTEIGWAEYWSRIWIVQEYTLARDVILLTDRSQMNGKDLSQIYTSLVRGYASALRVISQEFLFSSLFIALNRSSNTPMIKLMESDYGHSLYELMHRFRHSRCLDLRDHVYALLSLADPGDLEYYAIHPDYSKSGVLLFTELTYKSMRQQKLTGRCANTNTLLCRMLGIREELGDELCRKIAAKVELNDESGRESWDEEVAEELAQLVLAIEQK